VQGVVLEAVLLALITVDLIRFVGGAEEPVGPLHRPVLPQEMTHHDPLEVPKTQ